MVGINGAHGVRAGEPPRAARLAITAPMLALTPPELVELLVTLPADRTPFIWGPPGIGKSALVREAADLLAVPCVTLLGTQIAPEDLIGVPRITARDGGGFATEFCPPKAILRADPFLLFIDELNSAVPDVQKAFIRSSSTAASATTSCPGLARRRRWQPRRGSRLVRPMATALANRMVHVALSADVEAWLAWGAANNLHALVLAFIRARPDRLFELPPSDATPAYPTPRAWHLLSDALATVSEGLWAALAAGRSGIAPAPSGRPSPSARARPLRSRPSPRGRRLYRGIPSSSISSPRAASPSWGRRRGPTASWRPRSSPPSAPPRKRSRSGPWTRPSRASSARRRSPPSEEHIRGSGAQVLIDVLRLGRFAREGAVK